MSASFGVHPSADSTGQSQDEGGRTANYLDRRNFSRFIKCVGAGKFMLLLLVIITGTSGPPSARSEANLRSEEHTSELQSLMRISYAVFCLKKKNNTQQRVYNHNTHSITPNNSTIHYSPLIITYSRF